MLTPYQLSRTKTQLKDLGHPSIGVEFKDGTKHFGKVSKFTRDTIYFVDRNGVELDAPRRLIQRALFRCMFWRAKCVLPKQQSPTTRAVDF